MKKNGVTSSSEYAFCDLKTELTYNVDRLRGG